jgi:type IX secretion system PorP/SprF family membrane protein
MKKLFLTIALILFVVVSTIAQQFPITSQPLSNAYFFNPAAAGVQGFLDISIGGRHQWTGIENAPKTYYLYANSILGKPSGKDFSYLSLPVSNPGYYDLLNKGKTKVKHGLGGRVFSDSYGAFNETGIGADYAIHLPIKEKLYLALGLGFDISNFQFDQLKAVVLEDNDPTYNQFLSGQKSKILFNGRFGAYLYSDRFRLGYSIDQLVPNNLSGETGGGSIQGKRMHHFANASYRFSLNKIGLTPSASALFTTNAPASIYGGLILDYNRIFLISGAYRNDGSVILGLGLTLLKIVRFTYTYDLAIGELGNAKSATHELVIKLMLNRNKSSQ